MRLTAKFLTASLAVVAIGGFLVWGTQFPSYVRTSARAIQEQVQEQVPVEFELRRARDMIEGILPELQDQVRRIAEEEIAIAQLEKDIEQSKGRLSVEAVTLSSLRDKMRVQKVSYSYQDREVSRTQLTEQIARRFDRFKQGELTLASKERLLEKRQDVLRNALAALESMKHRKVEMEQKVEMLAAQSQALQSSQIQAGVLIDGSELSEADQLLGDIETRLAVAQKVLDFEHEMSPETSNWSDEIVDEEQVLLEFDRYFDDNEDQDTTRTMVVDTVEL